MNIEMNASMRPEGNWSDCIYPCGKRMQTDTMLFALLCAPYQFKWTDRNLFLSGITERYSAPCS